MEKSIKELPLPDKIKAIAIYKRYKQIRKIEDDMQTAIREVEKKYLKLDEPVLNNVNSLLRRSLTLSVESEASTRPNSRIFPSTSAKKRSRKPLNTFRHARSTVTGENPSQDQESSRRTWEKMTINSSMPSIISTLSMRKALTTSP